jgi:hypothetical protein
MRLPVVSVMKTGIERQSASWRFRIISISYAGMQKEFPENNLL